MTDRRLRIDPLIPWDGAYPYLVLQPLGLTPQSTTTQVLDASYSMTSEQIEDPVLNDAWEALRIAKSRLVVDFFCLDLPDPANPVPGSGRPEALTFALAAAMEPGLPDPVFPDISLALPAALLGEEPAFLSPAQHEEGHRP